MTTTRGVEGADFTLEELDAAIDWGCRLSMVSTYPELRVAEAEGERLREEFNLRGAVVEQELVAATIGRLHVASSLFASINRSSVKIEWSSCVNDDGREGLMAVVDGVEFRVWLPEDVSVHRELASPAVDAFRAATAACFENTRKIGVLSQQLDAARWKLASDVKTRLAVRILQAGGDAEVKVQKSFLKEIHFYAVHKKWPGEGVTTSEAVTGGGANGG